METFVADNKTGLNAQYDPGSTPFGLSQAIGSTGAPGSVPAVVDAPAGVGGGGVIASPVVSVPGASSQVAANMPAVPVTQGDTSGMSSDVPVYPVPGVQGIDGYLDTGSGEGTSITEGHHPNSMARRG